MATMQVEVSASDAQRLAEPIEDAKRARLFKRVCDLEYTLVKTRDALTVITRSLEDFAEGHASTEERQRHPLNDCDVSLMFGVVNLLEYVAAECGRAVNEGSAGDE